MYEDILNKLPVAVIPAYKPLPVVINIAKELINSKSFQGVVCINDGSGHEFDNIFKELKSLGVHVETHAVNLGKGTALKTGFNAVLNYFPESCGVVTLDADGQHLSKDVINIANNLLHSENTLITGGRVFDNKEIPLRSRFGNKLTKIIFRFFSGVKINDTQTGLRGIPASLLPDLIKLKTTGYDFELDMLIFAKEKHISIKEIHITTVYENGNSSSHFNPVLDSLRIYFVFFRYLWVAILSFIIDFSMLEIFMHILDVPDAPNDNQIAQISMTVIAANILARLVSSTFNFILNRRFVFKSKSNIFDEYKKYFVLVIYVLIINNAVFYFLLNNDAMQDITGLGAVFLEITKLITEMITFFITFVISRTIIFKNDK